MARKKDAEEDMASKAILDQLQTKTVGPPPTSTGLTGDQLPATIFDIQDFDLVKNQVTLQLSNLELLNVLNTVGQITNTQSVSGPMPGTQKIIQKSYTSTGADEVFFQPDQGQVWQLVGGDTKTSGGAGTANWHLKKHDENIFALVFQTSVTSGQEPIWQNTTNNNIVGPIFVSYNQPLYIELTAIGTDLRASLSFIRIR